jgi:hypothetical protein
MGEMQLAELEGRVVGLQQALETAEGQHDRQYAGLLQAEA